MSKMKEIYLCPHCIKKTVRLFFWAKRFGLCWLGYVYFTFTSRLLSVDDINPFYHEKVM